MRSSDLPSITQDYYWDT